jgi:Domain of unknown function (DUF5666)
MTEPGPIVPLTPVQPGGAAFEPAPVEPEGTTPPDSRTPSGSRHKRSSSPFVRVGIVTGTAALVLVGAVAAMGASPSPSGSTTTPTPPSASGAPNMGGMGGPGRMMGDFGGVERGFGAITITSIDGSNLSLATEDGWTRTIAVTSETTITKAGATIAVGDLAVGDEIRFAQTQAADGTFTITKIVVVMPSLGGEVTAKTSDTITVTRRDGTTATIHVDGATTYTVDGVAGKTLADIAVGDHVRAEGTSNSDGSLDAATVNSGFGRDGKGPGDDHGPGHGPDGTDPDDSTPGASPDASATPG